MITSNGYGSSSRWRRRGWWRFVEGCFFSVYHVSDPRFWHSPMYFSNLKNFHYRLLHTRHNDSVQRCIDRYTNIYLFSTHEPKIFGTRYFTCKHISMVSHDIGESCITAYAWPGLARLQKLMLLSADMTLILPTSSVSLSPRHFYHSDKTQIFVDFRCGLAFSNQSH